MRQHLAECADCRAYYERHLVLAELDPIIASPKERLAVGLGLESRSSARAPLIGSLAVAAAGAWLLVGSPELPALRSAPSPELAAASPVLEETAPSASFGDREFAARGVPASDDPELFVYRVSKGGRPERAINRIGRSDELAITYSNRAGYEQLLVFAVDEHGHVFWYYPAWTDASEDPMGIPIETVSAARELPDAVAHPLDGSQLRLVGLFTRAPLSVRTIEERLKRSPSARLGLPGTFEIELRLRVEGAP